jgi:hypothetical protein
MKNEAGCWAAQIDGHLQGICDEIGPHVISHGKADDTAALEVDHRR